MLTSLAAALAQNWHAWLVTMVLIVAAAIDGWKLKVPNWLTLPFVLCGWAYGAAFFGWEGLGYSLAGTAVGLALLLPAYAVGGMGAGDVKLLAGVGAWMGISTTFQAFCISVFVGAVIAIVMVLWAGKWRHHRSQFTAILMEILTIRDPNRLSQLAADRKSSMRLLPYGIPIAIGSIAYFTWSGMLL